MDEVHGDRWNDGGIEVGTDKLADQVNDLEQVFVRSVGGERYGEGERRVKCINGLMSEFALARGVFDEMGPGRWVG